MKKIKLLKNNISDTKYILCIILNSITNILKSVHNTKKSNFLSEQLKAFNCQLFMDTISRANYFKLYFKT